MENNIFKRTEAKGTIIEDRTYNMILGATLLWGFFINWLIVKNVDYYTIASINPILFYIGYLGSAFLGIYLFRKSDKPSVSFLGYNLVVIPFGFIINLTVHQYDSEIVAEALRLTSLVTVSMMILGTMFPKFFKKIIGVLSISLIIVIVIELIEVFIFHMHHGILDWIVVAIFAGYIGYDWGRANQIPKTVDNAIDSAAALYLDIINLFIRILRILGRRR